MDKGKGALHDCAARLIFIVRILLDNLRFGEETLP